MNTSDDDDVERFKFINSNQKVEIYLNKKNDKNKTPNNFFIDSLLSKNNESSSNTTALAVTATAAFIQQQMFNKMCSNNEQLLQLLNQNILSAFAQPKVFKVP